MRAGGASWFAGHHGGRGITHHPRVDVYGPDGGAGPAACAAARSLLRADAAPFVPSERGGGEAGASGDAVGVQGGDVMNMFNGAGGAANTGAAGAARRAHARAAATATGATGNGHGIITGGVSLPVMTRE